MKAKWDSEKELAKTIVDHLRSDGWTVYPELCDIDIVATKANAESPNGLKIIGIECKKHFNLTVLAQAHRKKLFVDEMFVGVAAGWKDNESFGSLVAKKFGLGVYFATKLASHLGTFKYFVKQAVAAENVNRHHSYTIDKMLDPKAENYAEAGQAGGKHWSLFQKTASAIVEYVKENPGKTLGEVIAAVPHHYSSKASARSSLKKLLEQGIIEGVSYNNDILTAK